MLPPEVETALRMVGHGVSADELESHTLDFKTVAASPRATLAMLADALVCFVNADGGTVVLGVDDKATTRTEALVGVPSSYSLDQIRKAIHERTRPPITAFVTELLVEGARLVSLTVPPGVLPHSNASGLATRRLGAQCLPFTPQQQREVMMARGQVDWSADASGVDVTDLSRTEFDRVRELLVTTGQDHLAELPDRGLLTALRLIATNGSVTNAGVLLFADANTIRSAVPGYGYSYQYRASSGSEASARVRDNRPVLAAVASIVDAIDVRLEVYPLNVDGGVQHQLSDYPPQAVRELIVNAFVHRSYETDGTVDIEHSPERLVITSPGGLVAGVTPANILTHPSTPRNRLLAEAVSQLRLAERTGQGVDRAYREMLRAGKEPPSFEDRGTLVRASLAGGIGNDAFARFLARLPGGASRDVNVLLALSTLRTSSSLDAPRLATIIQRPPAEAQEVLVALCNDLGVLEPTRRTMKKPFPSYRLRSETLAAMSRAVTYHRRSLDETDQKLIEHVREYGFVTNRTVQRMFDVHVYAAKDILADLRARQILSKLGDARGGPNVRYGPGPRFPAS